MTGEPPHPRESRDAHTVPGRALPCNASLGEEPTHSCERWRHPSILAALISATATVIAAVISVVLIKVL
jgi:hypothetical protein